MTATTVNDRSARERLQAFVSHRWFQRTIITLIVVNGITLGMETWDSAMDVAGTYIVALDRAILAVFVIEIVLRIAAYGPGRFFRDPWGVFDFVVVAIALMPATGSLSVLRALRILRVLRLISAVPSMRKVVQGLLVAIPGLGSIMALLLLIFYVAAVIATKLFGDAFPQWFGTIGSSMFSLFQIMTLESWSMGIVRPVMEAFPFAWLFFVPFILVATFTVLNLFIAVVVSAMQSEHDAEIRADREVTRAAEEAAHSERTELRDEVRALGRQIAELRQEIERR